MQLSDQGVLFITNRHAAEGSTAAAAHFYRFGGQGRIGMGCIQKMDVHAQGHGRLTR